MTVIFSVLLEVAVDKDRSLPVNHQNDLSENSKYIRGNYPVVMLYLVRVIIINYYY